MVDPQYMIVLCPWCHKTTKHRLLAKNAERCPHCYKHFLVKDGQPVEATEDD